MLGTIFKAHLIRKLIVAGAFGALTIGAVVGVNVANEAIKPYEGFITDALVAVDTKGEKNNFGDKLAVEIEQEGIVLAKNNDNILPLDKENKKIDVYGHAVIDWLISNSGSGSSGPGSSQKTVGLLEAFDSYGVEYNANVIDYYKKWVAPRSLPYSIQSGYDSLYRLADPSLSQVAAYKEVYDAAKSAEDVDTAIVCLSRAAGEHIDPPHEQINNLATTSSKKFTNKERGYLEITTEEEELLTAVGQDYDKVIVIINSSNVMQMDFMERIPGLDACLLVGPTGTVGAKAIPQVLYGDVNPSGRTADTWPMNHRYNPAYFTSGYFPTGKGPKYTGAPSGANLSSSNSSGPSGDGVNFADYLEGIYVGYRWYETAYAEGYWDNDTYGGYENVVAYPFGHGLSYTTFKWEFATSLPAKNSNIKDNEAIQLFVDVTNTGKVPGRDVVEVYLTAPYTKGGIEKSAVKLIGYQKTKNLMPGETERVQINVYTRDFQSFDCYDKNGNGHAGWELDKGDYEIRFMTSAHLDKQGCSSIKYRISDTINVDYDDTTGEEVKPLFTGEEAIDGISCDGLSIGEPIDYLTRENFAPLLTKVNDNRAWNKELTNTHKYSKAQKDAWDNATGVDAFGKPIPETNPTFGQDSGLKVTDELYQLTDLGRDLANDYNSDKWDALLDEVKWEESTAITANSSSYNRPGIKSVGLREGKSSDYKDVEAASQVGVDLDNKTRRLTAYPTPTVQAQCWNVRMPYMFGLSEAKDMVIGGADASYGPASNIHRTPYGGRNSEYHSEDGFLAGCTLAGVTKGLADGGKQGFIKHFAVNDTEWHRVGLFTWLTEQALREIYLRPFEEAIKRGEATALMTSFNRVGAIWTGSSQALCQGVMRNEWGFKGMTITDMIENSTLMDVQSTFRAGNNYVLGGSGWNTGIGGGAPKQSSSTPRLQHRVRENAKQVIYAHIRVLRLNEIYNDGDSVGPVAGNQSVISIKKAGINNLHIAKKNYLDLQADSGAIVASSSKKPWVWWKPALHCLEALLIVACVFGIICALIPANPEFRKEAKDRLFKKKKGDEQEEQVEQKPEEKQEVQPEKKENWFLRHMRLTAAIAIFGVTFIVIGCVMLSSYTSYKNYEKTYYANDLAVRSASAAAPKVVEINNNYKSQYKKKVVADGDKVTLNENKISLVLELKENSFADIDVVFTYEATEDLLSNMNIKVNDSLVEEDGVVVKEEGQHHLVMSGFALPEGALKMEIEGIKNKTMPEIQSVTFYTNAVASFAE